MKQEWSIGELRQHLAGKFDMLHLWRKRPYYESQGASLPEQKCHRRQIASARHLPLSVDQAPGDYSLNR
jgi:hypothetical protein